MLRVWIVLAESGEAKHQSRVLLVRRYREEDAISIIHPGTELSVTHELPYRLRAGQMHRDKILSPRQLLFQRTEAGGIW